MQHLKPHVYFYDDDEFVGHYLDHLRVRNLFDATGDTAQALSENISYFWTMCCHLRYPSGKLQPGAVALPRGGSSSSARLSPAE